MDLELDVDLDIFYENISNVSLKNNEELREKLHYICSNNNLWDITDIYEDIYNTDYYLELTTFSFLVDFFSFTSTVSPFNNLTILLKTSSLYK